MGLIKDNFYIKELAIEVPAAYARITSLSIGMDGQTASMLQVKLTREAFDNTDIAPLSTLYVNFKADKNLSIWEQTYLEFKKLEELSDWKDDIVE